MPDTRLFYIHDPMCSWCYAFRSNLTALHNNLSPSIAIDYLLGGLAPDTTVPMPADLQEMIQQTWRRIETTVPNMHFNYDFWNNNTPYRSTYPACRAILSARRQGSSFEAKILQAIQQAYYQEAKNPSLQTTLQECAIKVGLDPVKFIKDLNSSVIEKELQKEIKLSRSMGISSYPSLCLRHKGQHYLIAVDYLNTQEMIDKINRKLINISS